MTGWPSPSPTPPVARRLSVGFRRRGHLHTDPPGPYLHLGWGVYRQSHSTGSWRQRHADRAELHHGHLRRHGRILGHAPQRECAVDRHLHQPEQRRSAYEWAFGDGAPSTATHPAHTYTQTGSFTVVLTATAGSESDSEVKVDYVTVNAASAGELVTTTITYTYDSLYRLTEADYSSGEKFEYAYDAVGNMTAVTTMITSTVVSTREYDIANPVVAGRTVPS